MIEITGRQQFTKAHARALREHMRVRRYEPGLVEVQNPAHGSTYHVRFERQDGKLFGTCTCEAGTPHKRAHVPMVCKHLYVAVLFVRAMRAMKMAARAH